MGDTFFTSDTHYGHANIIIYTERPFLQKGDLDQDNRWVSKRIARERANAMDDFIVKKHNEVVTPNDDVYHLGDYLYGRTDDVIRILRRLNFRNIYFIWGNHDSALKDFASILRFYPDLKNRVHFLGDMGHITIEGQEIVLTHYAMKVWNRSHYGAWNLYGHSHGTLPDDPHARAIDVGVDVHGYRPLSFHEVSTYMSKKLFIPIDHHKRKEGGGSGMDKAQFEKHERRRIYLQLKKEFENE
jgi:calcineurin-like phosphoesterase family protein